MMDPFFRNRWNPPSHPRTSPSVRGIPVQNQATPSPKSAPKVVSIPVHFVESARMQSASAAKIQKVFRGFLVRKSVKKILAIRREVDEVERSVSASDEILELIREDSKERLRINETLMALLFRLDSVRGVDAAVRDCRKGVIKKAIALQEFVDAVAAGDETLSTVQDGPPETNDRDQEREEEDSARDPDGTIAESVEETLEIANSTMERAADCENRIDEAEETQGNSSNARDCAHTVDNSNFSSAQTALDCDACMRKIDTKMQEDCECVVECDNQLDQAEGTQGNSFSAQDLAAVVDNSDFSSAQTSLDSDACVGKVDNMQEDCEEKMLESGRVDEVKGLPPSPMVVESEEPSVTAEEHMESDAQSGSRETKAEGGGDGKEGEALERLMRENEKLVGLVTNLSQSNVVQARLLNSLVQRVEQLERAFLCEKLRKKKKRRSSGASVGGANEHSSGASVGGANEHSSSPDHNRSASC